MGIQLAHPATHPKAGSVLATKLWWVWLFFLRLLCGNLILRAKFDHRVINKKRDAEDLKWQKAHSNQSKEPGEGDATKGRRRGNLLVVRFYCLDVITEWAAFNLNFGLFH